MIELHYLKGMISLLFEEYFIGPNVREISRIYLTTLFCLYDNKYNDKNNV